MCKQVLRWTSRWADIQAGADVNKLGWRPNALKTRPVKDGSERARARGGQEGVQEKTTTNQAPMAVLSFRDGDISQ